MCRLGLILALNLLVTTPTMPGYAGPDSSRMPKTRTLLTSSPSQDFVVLEGLGIVRLVDPATGEERWHAGGGDGLAAAVVGTEGIVYVSISASDGSATEVVAVRMPSAASESIGPAPGLAMVKGRSSVGERLFVVRFDGELPVDTPSGITDLVIPDDWRSEALAPRVTRELGGGVLAQDGEHWYSLRARATADEQTTSGELLVADFAGDQVSWSSIPVPMTAGFHSLLLSPDGDRMYVVDYFGQAIQVVDLDQRLVVRSFELPRTPTKRPVCAATLSPQGDRLYVVGHNADDTGDGVLAFDTGSWQQVGHLMPGQDLYCLAVSPDGDFLYAVTMALVNGSPDATTLVTIDARTGAEIRTVALDIDECGCPFPVGVVSAPSGESSAGRATASAHGPVF